MLRSALFAAMSLTLFSTLVSHGAWAQSGTKKVVRHGETACVVPAVGLSNPKKPKKPVTRYLEVINNTGDSIYVAKSDPNYKRFENGKSIRPGQSARFESELAPPQVFGAFGTGKRCYGGKLVMTKARVTQYVLQPGKAKAPKKNKGGGGQAAGKGQKTPKKTTGARPVAQPGRKVITRNKISTCPRVNKDLSKMPNDPNGFAARTVEFTNNSGQTLTVEWVHYSGVLTRWKKLEPGETHLMDVLGPLPQNFVAKTDGGACLGGILKASKFRKTSFVLEKGKTVKGQGSGAGKGTGKSTGKGGGQAAGAATSAKTAKPGRKVIVRRKIQSCPVFKAGMSKQAKSANSYPKRTMEFVNDSDRAVTINWVSYDGSLRPSQFQLEPGSASTRGVFGPMPQTFVAMTADGKCLGGTLKMSARQTTAYRFEKDPKASAGAGGATSKTGGQSAGNSKPAPTGRKEITRHKVAACPVTKAGLSKRPKAGKSYPDRTIEFHNNSSGPLTIYWVMYDGQLRKSQTVPAGGAMTSTSARPAPQTYLAKTAAGECVGGFLKMSKKATTVVRLKDDPKAKQGNGQTSGAGQSGGQTSAGGSNPKAGNAVTPGVKRLARGQITSCPQPTTGMTKAAKPGASYPLQKVNFINKPGGDNLTIYQVLANGQLELVGHLSGHGHLGTYQEGPMPQAFIAKRDDGTCRGGLLKKTGFATTEFILSPDPNANAAPAAGGAGAVKVATSGQGAPAPNTSVKRVDKRKITTCPAYVAGLSAVYDAGNVHDRTIEVVNTSGEFVQFYRVTQSGGLELLHSLSDGRSFTRVLQYPAPQTFVADIGQGKCIGGKMVMRNHEKTVFNLLPTKAGGGGNAGTSAGTGGGNTGSTLNVANTTNGSPGFNFGNSTSGGTNGLFANGTPPTTSPAVAAIVYEKIKVPGATIKLSGPVTFAQAFGQMTGNTTSDLFGRQVAVPVHTPSVRTRWNCQAAQKPSQPSGSGDLRVSMLNNTSDVLILKRVHETGKLVKIGTLGAQENRVLTGVRAGEYYVLHNRAGECAGNVFGGGTKTNTLLRILP